MAVDASSVGLFVAQLLLMMAVLYFVVWMVTRESVLRAPYLIRLLAMAFVALLILPAVQILLSGYGVAGVGLGLVAAFLLLVVLTRYVVVSEVSLHNEWVEAVVIAVVFVAVILLMNLALDRYGYEPLVTSLLG